MYKLTYHLFLLLVLFNSCIGDDIVFDEVDPEIRITNPIDSIEINTTYQFEYLYLNNVGTEETIPVTWHSADPSVIDIDNFGLATGLTAGKSQITIVASPVGGVEIQDQIEVVVGESTVSSATERKGLLQSTSSYTLRGDFLLKEETGKLILSFGSNYQASSNLPGLFVYLTNNPTTTSGAFEIGKVAVFAGAHSYEITGVGLNDFSHVLYFCKPFNVKVGDGKFDN